jgi:hypothetical protein
MPKSALDKYELRSLHQEIDLFDRKLDYLLKYTEFETPEARQLAARSLSAKRDLLASKAQLMMDAGVVFEASELARSFRSFAEQPAVADGTVSIAAAAPLQFVPNAKIALQQPRPILSQRMQADILEYKRRKTKT